MTPQRIVVASQNPDKIREVESVIAQIAPSVGIVRGLKWPPIAETEPTLEGNALLKAKAVLEATGVAALADDTGPGSRCSRRRSRCAHGPFTRARLRLTKRTLSTFCAPWKTKRCVMPPFGPSLRSSMRTAPLPLPRGTSTAELDVGAGVMAVSGTTRFLWSKREASPRWVKKRRTE